MSEPGRYALIISNSKYEDSRLSSLPGPEVDARALAEILKDANIGAFDDVTILQEATKQQAEIGIETFFEGKGLYDTLLLYFTGHGVLDANNRLYLAGTDTRHSPRPPHLLRTATAIPAGFVVDQMNQTRSRRVILILDCCHSGAFPEGAKAATDVAVGTGAAFKGNGLGRVVMTASDATQFAWQGDTLKGEGAGSVFTRAIVEGLHSGQADMDRDGRITIHELYEYAQARVKELSSSDRPQSPGIWTYGLKGELVIARAARRKEEARARYQKIVGLIEQGAWAQAEAAWSELTAHFPNHEDHLQVGARMEQWRDARRAYDEMQRLVLAGKGTEALTLWAEIRKQFPDFPDGRELAKKASETAKQRRQRERLDGVYAEMGALAKQQRWQEVLARWQTILDEDAYYPDSQRLAERAQQALAQQQAQEERAVERQRLNQHYAAMEQLVARQEWKKAEERWQFIRQLDQSYPDSKKLVPAVKIGLKELKVREEAAQLRAYLDSRYEQMAAAAQAGQWREAHATWQKILERDPTYPDRRNLVPAIVSHVGTGAFERPVVEKKKGGGCLGRLAKVSVIGVVGLGLLGGGAVVAILLATILWPSPDPAPTAPIFLPTSPVREFVPQASCPFDADGFPVIPGVEHGVFQDAQGFVYSLQFDGASFLVRDGANVLSFSANVDPNQWTALVNTPFRVCAEPSSGNYYAAFDPFW